MYATGFDGWAVCGTYFLSQLQAHHSGIVRKCDHECLERVYRFGGGTARALSCVEILMTTPTTTTTPRQEWVLVDVVGGNLPMLIGRGLGSHVRLVIDVEPGTVLVKDKTDNWVPAAYNDPSGLIFLSLVGVVDVQQCAGAIQAEFPHGQSGSSHCAGG